MRNIADTENLLEAKKTYIRERLAAQEQATAEGRTITATERVDIETAMAEARSLKAQIDRKKGDADLMAELNALTAGVPSGTLRADGRAAVGGTLGQQFVRSDVFRWLQNSQRSRAGVWTSPMSSEIVFPSLYAATLTPDAASGGDLVTPEYRPGIIPTPTAPLTVADLLRPGTTTSNAIGYMEESAFTNAADTVAPGGTKPESTLSFNSVTDPVRKIATWIPVVEEMLSDVPALRNYIDARLRLGVDLALDDQLLQGSGVAPDILGLLNRTGLAAAIARGGGENNADAIQRQVLAIATTAQVPPTGIVMHPTNWGAIEVMKDANGGYLAGGPFVPRARKTLWGLDVAVTPAISVGTALVGSFGLSAQFFLRDSLRVDATNSHSDFFIKNLVAIRAEVRGALAVYKPGAFGPVTGLT